MEIARRNQIVNDKAWTVRGGGQRGGSLANRVCTISNLSEPILQRCNEAQRSTIHPSGNGTSSTSIARFLLRIQPIIDIRSKEYR